MKLIAGDFRYISPALPVLTVFKRHIAWLATLGYVWSNRGVENGHCLSLASAF